ncbi:hypothetical protein I305_05745 [Cryptococcus gattii E566]|uniref:Peptide hydrolase n=2 Tax=Cryptococcus gattii TaxID=37769 RepID=E6RAE9_CRYGW|nr:Hypothetical Protein CGB_H1150W [Cryptococcus gattii WM276]ADV23802.1 Hypothetical Protein CGB_H1150W [Cryptococcus gattii WM276]KIR81516.1 hypothetical protein I306_01353 [Cryptococcus gattii EJB2]KIY31786.1 hypothetical protein I305_05745 [Cryptococcus gattii E566]KJE02257.1 hypothetical protein I311_04137 [Cryptococcus gattii NT-10]
MPSKRTGSGVSSPIVKSSSKGKSKSTPKTLPRSTTSLSPQPHHHVPAPAPIHLPVHKASRLSWSLLGFILTVLPFWFSKLHYDLPEPLPPYDADGRPQPSEEIVLSHVQALENIGYRTVGTHEALAGEQYVLNQVLELVEKCNAGGILNCEWWHQKGSGFHAFEIIDHEVLKGYGGISNIILRIAAFHPPSYNVSQPKVEKDAILLGSHIDSTMPSPGASDDGIGVGVMLDTARILVERNEAFDGAIIFMWNGGEETLQDGSHLYSTEHSTAPTVKAIINLEAAGSTGGALLFQATSKEMIEAYMHVPFPSGTVIAADVFASGILMSDTDFGQFEKYLGVSGLDMAIVGDTVKHLQKGTAQHFTSNIQAIVDHLLSPSSPLLSPAPFSPPDVVYFSLFDRAFFHFPMSKADGWYISIAAVATALAFWHLSNKKAKAIVVAAIGTPLGVLGGLAGANAFASVLSATDNGLLWFRHEHLPLLLYVPVSYIALFSIHLVFTHFLSPVERTQLEVTHYYIQLLLSSWYMLLLQSFRVRSAYLYAMITALLLIGAVGNELGRMGRRGLWEGMSFKMTYLVPSIGLIALAVEAVTTALDIFTPLAGRMGKEAPAEHIVASLSVICGFVFFPTALPLFHRVSRMTQRKVMLGLVLGVLSTLVAMMGPWYFPYDEMHPKRVGVMYTYNHTSNKHVAHLAFMDRGPMSDIIPSLYSRYGAPDLPLEHTSLTDYDSDWDVFYPVSTFLDTYRFDLPVSEQAKEFTWPEMKWEVKDTKWENGIRKMILTFNFTGLVWPTLAFDASVVDWSFHFDPPAKKMQHHIKIATSVDAPVVDLRLDIRADEGQKLRIHWSAFDINQMVPGTAARDGPDMPASKMLLDLASWSREKYNDDLDIIMSGVVCGVIEV